MIRFLLCFAAVIMISSPGAFADDKHSAHTGHSPEKAYGRPGDPGKVSRTIEVGMSDAMRFTPAELVVKRGETIRLVAGNSGKVMHELVLGTLADLKAHSDAMKKGPAMDHGEEDNAVEVQPGKQGELVWQFTKAGRFNFGCLVPGHFEAGMVGSIVVR